MRFEFKGGRVKDEESAQTKARWYLFSRLRISMDPEVSQRGRSPTRGLRKVV